VTKQAIDDVMADLYRAMLADDVEVFDRVLADDLVYVHSAGAVEDKQEFVEAVRERHWEYKRVRPESQQIVTSGNMAVVHAVLDFEGGKRGDAHKPIRMFTTLVWMRREDQWRLILRQATKLPLAVS
jgi:uncharacterized protein (TIGR02246 family)